MPAIKCPTCDKELPPSGPTVKYADQYFCSYDCVKWKEENDKNIQAFKEYEQAHQEEDKMPDDQIAKTECFYCSREIGHDEFRHPKHGHVFCAGSCLGKYEEKYILTKDKCHQCGGFRPKNGTPFRLIHGKYFCGLACMDEYQQQHHIKSSDTEPAEQIKDLPTPTYKTFTYQVQVVSQDVELISLFTQVLESYPGTDRRAAVAWLIQALRQEESNKCES